MNQSFVIDSDSGIEEIVQSTSKPKTNITSSIDLTQYVKKLSNYTSQKNKGGFNSPRKATDLSTLGVPKPNIISSPAKKSKNIRRTLTSRNRNLLNPPIELSTSPSIQNDSGSDQFSLQNSNITGSSQKGSTSKAPKYQTKSTSSKFNKIDSILKDDRNFTNNSDPIKKAEINDLYIDPLLDSNTRAFIINSQAKMNKRESNAVIRLDSDKQNSTKKPVGDSRIQSRRIAAKKQSIVPSHSNWSPHSSSDENHKPSTIKAKSSDKKLRTYKNKEKRISLNTKKLELSTSESETDTSEDKTSNEEAGRWLDKDEKIPQTASQTQARVVGKPLSSKNLPIAKTTIDKTASSPFKKKASRLVSSSESESSKSSEESEDDIDLKTNTMKSNDQLSPSGNKKRNSRFFREMYNDYTNTSTEINLFGKNNDAAAYNDDSNQDSAQSSNTFDIYKMISNSSKNSSEVDDSEKLGSDENENLLLVKGINTEKPILYIESKDKNNSRDFLDSSSDSDTNLSYNTLLGKEKTKKGKEPDIISIESPKDFDFSMPSTDSKPNVYESDSSDFGLKPLYSVDGADSADSFGIGYEIDKSRISKYKLENELDILAKTSQSLKKTLRPRSSKKPKFRELLRKSKRRGPKSIKERFIFYSDNSDDIESNNEPMRLNSEMLKTRVFNKNKPKARRTDSRFLQKKQYQNSSYYNISSDNNNNSADSGTGSQSSSERSDARTNKRAKVSGNLSDFIVDDDDDEVLASQINKENFDYNNVFKDSEPFYLAKKKKKNSKVKDRSGSATTDDEQLGGGILDSMGMFSYQDLRTSFNTYIQYYVHKTLNKDFLESLDKRTANYFTSARTAVDRHIQSLKDSLVSSSVWHSYFLDDLKLLPIYHIEMISAEKGCEACTFNRSRTSKFMIYLIGSTQKPGSKKGLEKSAKQAFDRKRKDVYYRRFMSARLSSYVFLNNNLLPEEIKSYIRSSGSNNVLVSDLEKFGIYGACYKVGRFCQKRSELYHWMDHFPEYTMSTISRKVENILSSKDNLFDCNNPDKIQLAEDIVLLLEQSEFTDKFYRELTKVIDEAKELYMC
ncbi:hypothetical protein BB559_005061 [Furculomyces boomerangus]|uniref:DUF4211 domain-containing protein n=1 Tax=Furculomyces boomerangus TaxID=61424 RepID=A0A2T9YB43_9FUNG|nr:hypothetical protein BB559_005061 [Furculomyces boomerangus]